MARPKVRPRNEQASRHDRIKASDSGCRWQCKPVHPSDGALKGLARCTLVRATKLERSRRCRLVGTGEAEGHHHRHSDRGHRLRYDEQKGMPGRDMVVGLSGKMGAMSPTW